MSSSDPDLVFTLFDEYASAYARGERVDVARYLERAGEKAEELAELLDRYLAAAPRREPDTQTLAIVGAWLQGEPPLVRLRAEQGVRVDTVVAELISRLGLNSGQAAKVKRLYQQLEKGLLEPANVSAKVWNALSALLGPGVAEARRWRPGELRGAAAAFHRRSDEPLFEAASPPLPRQAVSDTDPGADRPDEIDELFGLT